MYYKKSINQTLEELKSSENGLNEKEAKLRLRQCGYNELKKRKRLSTLKIFLSQFKDPIVYILIIAVLISLVINHKLDATVIAAILFINAILGFSQEFKAEKALAMLKKISAPKARVLRNNQPLMIAARELVPGDILLLEQGDKISADARLIKVINLETDESILTGESTPVIKEISKINLDKVPIAEQSNMVFSGTIITNGRGRAIIRPKKKLRHHYKRD